MGNNYILYVGMDASKGKADAAILKVSDRRSVKPKFLRKKLSFKFVKSEVASFLETVRNYSDVNCTSICFALEVTGIYSTNVYNYIKTSVYKGYKRDKIEMRGDRAEISDFPLYLNTVAGGLDRRDQTIGGFSFIVKIYAVPVVEIIG